MTTQEPEDGLLDLLAAVARELGVSRQTLYRELNGGGKGREGSS